MVFCQSNPTEYMNSMPLSLMDLSEKARQSLKNSGIDSIEALIGLSEHELASLEGMTYSYVMEIIWELEKFDKELKRIGINYYGDVLLTSLTLSRRSKNALVKAGITTVGELFQESIMDLLEIPNLGMKSFNEITSFLKEFQTSRQIDKFLSNKEAGRPVIRYKMLMATGKSTWNLINESALRSSSIPVSKPIPEELKGMSIERLGLSRRGYNCLTAVGINTVYDLINTSGDKLLSITALGKKIIQEIDRAIEIIYISTTDLGIFSFSKYAKQSNHLICLPADFNADAESNFLHYIDSFFEEYLETLQKRERKIAKTRIWSNKSDYWTLEELGEKFSLSRERIRQIEKKIINSLRELLVERGAFRIHNQISTSICDPKFSERWRKAASEFSTVDEIDLYEFQLKLSEIWNVSIEGLKERLPLIAAVFTGSPSSNLSRESRLENTLPPLQNSSLKTKNTKLTAFRTGKGARKLAEEGFETIADVIEFWPMPDSIASKSILETLYKAENSLTDEGDIKWDDYLIQLNINRESGFSPESPLEFFSGFADFIAHCVPYVTTWDHCSEIYQLRTRHLPSSRMTLAQCAEVIPGFNSVGPMISRVERYLINRLREVFVRKDFCCCYVWIPPTVFEYMTKCAAFLKKSDDNFNCFRDLLSSEYELDLSIIDKSSAIIWAMLSGFNPDRYHHLKARRHLREKFIKSHVKLGQTVKLAGFRTVH